MDAASPTFHIVVIIAPSVAFKLNVTFTAFYIVLYCRFQWATLWHSDTAEQNFLMSLEQLAKEWNEVLTQTKKNVCSYRQMDYMYICVEAN